MSHTYLARGWQIKPYISLKRFDEEFVNHDQLKQLAEKHGFGHFMNYVANTKPSHKDALHTIESDQKFKEYVHALVERALSVARDMHVKTYAMQDARPQTLPPKKE